MTRISRPRDISIAHFNIKKIEVISKTEKWFEVKGLLNRTGPPKKLGG